MSYLNIMSFIDSGKKSLNDKNYWSALSVALILPSMCSRIAFSNEKDKYMKFKWNDKSDHSKGKTYTDWKDKECYVDFCKEVMRVNQSEGNPKGKYNLWLTSVLGSEFAEVLYQLRCDIVHAGIANVYNDNKQIVLMLGDERNTELTKYQTINIKDLCSAIFEHVSTWCSNNSVENFKYTYVFDTENSDNDRVLYRRLCDDDRADDLKKSFERDMQATSHVDSRK